MSESWNVPDTAPMPQTARPYVRLAGEYMSLILAPPVARLGLPMKPVRKRKARSMPKFAASAVGTCRTTKSSNVRM